METFLYGKGDSQSNHEVTYRKKNIFNKSTLDKGLLYKIYKELKKRGSK